MTQQRRTSRNTRTSPTPSIQYRFAKSNDYRVVHADGAWGGITPQGNLSMGLFAERRSAPETVTYQMTETGLQETGRTGPQPTIRELQVEVVLSTEVARSLIGWLQGHVETAEKALAQAIANSESTSTAGPKPDRRLRGETRR